MVISGLVLTLCDAPRRSPEIFERLRADSRFTLGAPLGPRLPLVAEANDSTDAERLVDELRHIAGVLNVDVAFVEIDPADAESQSGCAFGRRRHPDRPAPNSNTPDTCTLPKERSDADPDARR